jgi:hypothetical protein
MSNRKEVVKFVAAGARSHAESFLLASGGRRRLSAQAPREKHRSRATSGMRFEVICSRAEQDVPLPRDRFHGSLSFAKCSDHPA